MGVGADCLSTHYTINSIEISHDFKTKENRIADHKCCLYNSQNILLQETISNEANLVCLGKIDECFIRNKTQIIKCFQYAIVIVPDYLCNNY